MRLANLPLFGIICIAIRFAPVSARLRLIWLSIIALHAFVWYYLNEARPILCCLPARPSPAWQRWGSSATPILSIRSDSRFRFGVVRRRVDPHGRQQYPRRTVGRFDHNGDRLYRRQQYRGSFARRRKIWPIILFLYCISAAIIRSNFIVSQPAPAQARTRGFPSARWSMDFSNCLAWRASDLVATSCASQSGNLLQADIGIMLAAAAIGGLVVFWPSSALTRACRSSLNRVRPSRIAFGADRIRASLARRW